MLWCHFFQEPDCLHQWLLHWTGYLTDMPLCLFFLFYFSDQDGAEPSANSVSAMNLLRLSHLTGRQDWIQRSQELLIAFSDRLTKVPIALPDMVRSVMAQHYTLKQVTGPQVLNMNFGFRFHFWFDLSHHVQLMQWKWNAFPRMWILH